MFLSVCDGKIAVHVTIPDADTGTNALNVGTLGGVPIRIETEEASE